MIWVWMTGLHLLQLIISPGGLWFNLWSKHRCTSAVFSLWMSGSKSAAPVLLVTVNCPPGPYSEFLWCIWLHVESHLTLSSSFPALIDSWIQSTCGGPTHCCSPTLDLVLTYGSEVKDLKVFPQKPAVCDHLWSGYSSLHNDVCDKRICSNRDLSDRKFLLCLDSSLLSMLPWTALRVLVLHALMVLLSLTLDSVVPLKRKVVSPRR